MVNTIIHRTPGLLDIKALTVMGLSVKPTVDNPIGMFGTGLKYAIATLVRLGAEPIIWIGKEKYTFSTAKGKFRGAEYQRIRMRKESDSILKPRWVDLPYTTEYGKFWLPWMAFRELESNTRDEAGETWNHDVDIGDWPGKYNETLIIINHPEYFAAYALKMEIFLEGASRNIDREKILEHYPGESMYLYWRGLRVYDLEKPTLFKYNFTGDLRLTEDRTLQSSYAARTALASWVVTLKDEEVIKKIITAKHSHWEHRLDFPSYVRPSDAFMKVVQKVKSDAPGAMSYVSKWLPSEPRAKTEWDKALRPWFLDGDMIFDNNGKHILNKPEGFRGDWKEFANHFIGKINGQSLMPEVDF